MKSLFTYLKNVRAELEHVVWPKPRTAATHTLLIILISVAFALLISGFDYVFTNLVGVFIR
ncbi:MAG: preprotein translocase subunit SecE [Candidatus Pacebacteria bacterium]|nr:preprotein translocase subunit SecE [Candidatus Paceibacterota bacterium]